MKFDEDYGYERQRQLKADYGIHRPQRYERVDTSKHIPFADAEPPVPKIDWSFWVSIAMLLLLALGCVGYSYAQSSTYCWPDGKGGQICQPCPRYTWCEK